MTKSLVTVHDLQPGDVIMFPANLDLIGTYMKAEHDRHGWDVLYKPTTPSDAVPRWHGLDERGYVYRLTVPA